MFMGLGRTLLIRVMWQAFSKGALRGEPLVIYGDEERTRNFIHVNDVSEVILKIIEGNAFDNEVYNVDTGKPTTAKRLAEIMKEVAGKI